MNKILIFLNTLIFILLVGTFIFFTQNNERGIELESESKMLIESKIIVDIEITEGIKIE